MTPARVPARFQRVVHEAAQGYCAYCHSREALMGVTFEVEHIIPLSRGGKTTVDNLCLACPTCNRHKATRATAVDPSTHKRVTLFHPLRDSWAAHFKWSPDDTELIGLTSIGRATIEALHMNRPAIIELRRYWVAVGHHPPE